MLELFSESVCTMKQPSKHAEAHMESAEVPFLVDPAGAGPFGRVWEEYHVHEPYNSRIYATSLHMVYNFEIIYTELPCSCCRTRTPPIGPLLASWLRLLTLEFPAGKI